MKAFLIFARAYPRRTAMVVACLLLAGLAEGLGFSSMLPLIGLAARGMRGGSAATGAPSDLEQRILDAFQVIGLDPKAGVLLAGVVVAMVLKAALVMAGNLHVGYAVAQVATDLRLALIRALLRTRWQYYVHQPLGTFANAIANEARRAAEAYNRAASALSLLLMTMVSAVFAFVVSGTATVVALTAGAFIVFILNRLVRMARRAGQRQTKLTRSLLARLTDTLQAVKPLRAMARETLIGPLLESDTQKLNRALQREVLSKEALRALQEPLITSFLASGLYLVLTYTTLPLASVIMLALLCARIVSGLGRVQKEMQQLASNESNYWALHRTIAEAESAIEVRSGKRAPALRHAIELADVSFSYGERWVLKNASMIVPAQQLTVLVGPSGAGKTTVADLVIGLLEPQSGAVRIDGVALAEIDARRWRSSIGYVPQEMFLLHESIRLNVTLGDPDLGGADVEAALRAAGAWQFVCELPRGMDTMAGERGMRISGGQRQRIALARALVRRPALLILDEATAGLDPCTEAEICATLQELRARMTVLAISHHGALASIADRVYQVERGRIELRHDSTRRMAMATGA